MPSMPSQPVARLERGHLAEELERVVAALLADPAQGRLDPGAFWLARPPGRIVSTSSGSGAASIAAQSGADAVGQPDAAPAGARVVGLDLAVARVARAQRLERDLGVRVGAVLGEDRQDQLARRVEPSLPGRPAVPPGQLVEDERHEPGPIALEALRPGPARVGEPPLARASGRADAGRSSGAASTSAIVDAVTGSRQPGSDAPTPGAARAPTGQRSVVGEAGPPPTIVDRATRRRRP